MNRMMIACIYDLGEVSDKLSFLSSCNPNGDVDEVMGGMGLIIGNIKDQVDSIREYIRNLCTDEDEEKKSLEAVNQKIKKIRDHFTMQTVFIKATVEAYFEMVERGEVDTEKINEYFRDVLRHQVGFGEEDDLISRALVEECKHFFTRVKPVESKTAATA